LSVPTLDASARALLMDDLTSIVARAAEAILALEKRSDARTKADGSPVTAADEAAEAIICEGLRRLSPGLPIISEEQAERPGLTESGSYFLVDPLDGTREFIAGRDEYTVNVALMTERVPQLGVICAPATGTIWRGNVGQGADRIERAASGKPVPIRVRPQPADDVIVMASRSHLDPHTQAFLKALPCRATMMQIGSSVKFCWIADGKADLYPRLAPTHDWDIAAGHAILQAAGGSVMRPDGSPIVYGTKELLIPAFVGRGGITA
jgi:3'(2'), 5'-bisphosphate nucleotidase